MALEIDHGRTDLLGDSLNSRLGGMQAFTAKTPEVLAGFIRSIRFEIRVHGFTVHAGGHTVYLTSARRIKIKGRDNG